MKKKLMEAIANVGGFALSDGECVSDTIYFSDMVGLIDDLIKERKRLKKENKQLREGNELFRLKEAETSMNDTKPVAEFKCAKTNKPNSEGRYLCVIKGEYYQYRTIWFWYSGQRDESETEGLELLAFTEASQEDILKNLKS